MSQQVIVSRLVTVACVVVPAGIVWVALLIHFAPTRAELDTSDDTTWLSECAQHRPLTECDHDLATLKARK